MAQEKTQHSVRLDTWLWAARFYRTRALARSAIAVGRVKVNGQVGKAGQPLRIGSTLSMVVGPSRWIVEVLSLNPKRGPAAMARSMYRESEENRQAREAGVAQYRLIRKASPAPTSRPDKHSRRRLQDIKRGK